MNIDKDLIRYCEENDFPIDEMTIEQFKTIENSFVFNRYKLGILFKDLGEEVLNSFKNILKKTKNR